MPSVYLLSPSLFWPSLFPGQDRNQKSATKRWVKSPNWAEHIFLHQNFRPVPLHEVRGGRNALYCFAPKIQFSTTQHPNPETCRPGARWHQYLSDPSSQRQRHCWHNVGRAPVQPNPWIPSIDAEMTNPPNPLLGSKLFIHSLPQPGGHPRG